MSVPDDWCPECEGTGRELIEGGGTNPCQFGCEPPKPIPGPAIRENPYLDADLKAKLEQMRAIRAERAEA